MKTNKINYGEIYFKTMNKISPKVNNYIQKKINKLKINNELKEIICLLPKKREHQGVMRIAISYLTYKMFNGKKSTELIPLLAISELTNYYCYLDNWIFDNKNNIYGDQKKVSLVIIASEILRELAQETLEEIKSPKIRLILLKKLSNASAQCYEGQAQDILMSLDQINQFKTDEEFIQYAKNRARLQSGAWYGFSMEAGAILANANKKEIQQAREFGELLGEGMHISNDLGDFAPTFDGTTTFKAYQDQLSDLKNNRLTMPIYYAFKYGTELQKESLQKIIANKLPTKEELQEATNALIESSAKEKTNKLLNNCKNQLKRKTKLFPKNKFTSELSSVIQTIRYNKYLNALKLK